MTSENQSVFIIHESTCPRVEIHRGSLENQTSGAVKYEPNTTLKFYDPDEKVVFSCDLKTMVQDIQDLKDKFKYFVELVEKEVKEYNNNLLQYIEMNQEIQKNQRLMNKKFEERFDITEKLNCLKIEGTSDVLLKVLEQNFQNYAEKFREILAKNLELEKKNKMLSDLVKTLRPPVF